MQSMQALQFSCSLFEYHHQLPLPTWAAQEFSPSSIYATSLSGHCFLGVFVSLSRKSLPIHISPPKWLLPFQDLYRQVVSLFFHFFYSISVCLFLIAFFNVCLVSSFGLSSGSDNEESACNIGYLGSISGSGRPTGERNVYPLQYSCLENSMDR